MLRSKKKRAMLLGLVVSLCSATAALAGSMVELTCKNETCDYKGNLDFGGGFTFEQITGYCVHDKEFVYLTWKRGDKAPEPLKIWNPQTGLFTELYKCPKCTEPFLPIKELKELKYCPKCNQPTLEYHILGAYD
jgi:hypothetical protein